jgi:archaellin
MSIYEELNQTIIDFLLELGYTSGSTTKYQRVFSDQPEFERVNIYVSYDYGRNGINVHNMHLGFDGLDEAFSFSYNNTHKDFEVFEEYVKLPEDVFTIHKYPKAYTERVTMGNIKKFLEDNITDLV